MARKRNLVDEIKSLINPEPTIEDIENHDHDENTLATKILEVDLNQTDNESLEHSISKIRRNQILKLSSIDKRYAGKKIKRQDLDDSFENESYNDDDIEQDENDELSSEENENSNEESESEEENQSENYHELNIIDNNEDLNILNSQDDELRSKAISVKNQLSIYESLMGMRIKLQKLLSISNCLPSNISKLSNEQNSQILFQSIKGLQKLQNIFLSIDDFIDSKKSENEILETKKRKIARVNNSNLQKRFCSMKEYYPSIIDEWHQKTKFVHSNVNLKKFDSFGVLPSKVIEQILFDKERLINRTKIKRNDYKSIGDEDSNENCDMKIFDDDDFYQTILKQIISNKLNVGQDLLSSSKKLVEIQRLRSKSKKTIDTKASKGRKIRYDVHEKLVNFMAPQDKTIFSEEAKNDLFKSLFGNFCIEPI